MAFIRVILLFISVASVAISVFNFAKVLTSFVWQKIIIRKNNKQKAIIEDQKKEKNFSHKLWDILQKKFHGTFVEKHVKRYMDSRRTKELREGMPEALRLLCIALDSGNSLVQSFKYAAENCNEPLSSELKKSVWDLEAGLGFDESMEQLRSRCGSSEFAYLAAAMEIQHKSGGSMRLILQSVSRSLQQSIEMEQKLETKTAQARLSSKIVAIMPFALLCILTIFSPGYLWKFFSSPLGIFMFTCAICLEIVGVILIRRFLNIDINAHLGGELV